MRKFQYMSFIAIVAFSLMAGCDSETADTATDGNAPDTGTHTHADGTVHKNTPGDTGDHTHGEGPHGGTVADWGGGKFHVEFTVNHDKKEATVYILGDDEKTPKPVDAEEITLAINDPAFSVQLKAAPLEGDPEGKTSRFVGNHDNFGIVQEYQGSLSAAVDGTPYSGNFTEEAH